MKYLADGANTRATQRLLALLSLASPHQKPTQTCDLPYSQKLDIPIYQLHALDVLRTDAPANFRHLEGAAHAGEAQMPPIGPDDERPDIRSSCSDQHQSSPNNNEDILRDVSDLCFNRSHLAIVERIIPGGLENIQSIYALSPLQERVLFDSQLSGGDDSYSLSALLEIDSSVSTESFIKALQRVLDSNDALRSSVLWQQLPRPIQVVWRKAVPSVETLNFASDRGMLEQLKSRLTPQWQRWDLQCAPLIRLEIAPQPKDLRWYALIRVHHIICDHQSFHILISTIADSLEGHAPQQSFSETFNAVTNRTLGHRHESQLESFFRAKLREIDEPTSPFGVCEFRGAGQPMCEFRETLDSPLADSLYSVSGRTGQSVANLLHAAWSIVVANTSNREDVVFGTVIPSERPRHVNQTHFIGMEANTLPLRLQLTDLTAEELVSHTRHELADLLLHHGAPLNLAQRCSGVSPDAPLFTAVLNYRLRRYTSMPDPVHATKIKLLTTGEPWTNYPVTCVVDDTDEEIVVTLQTHASIDPKRLSGYFQTAIRSLMEALDTAPIAKALALQILPPHECELIAGSFNAPQRRFPGDRLVHHILEDQVERTPDAAAITCEGESLTYAELNARANQLARHLQDRGISPDKLVGLYVERGLLMVIGLLGILKAGGAYVPMDPTYPSERVAFILRDASPEVLVTTSQLAANLPETSADVVALDIVQLTNAKDPTNDLDLPSLGLQPHHLAYVIYTSGSTGRPKGVMVEHRNVSRLFSATYDWFKFNELDVWTLFHSIAFDFSVWELLGALFHGGCVVVVPYLTARSPLEFYRLICERGVTVINQTPSAFAQFIDAEASAHKPWSRKQNALRIVVFGGEALDLRTLRPWIERHSAGAPQLVNMYGITETTVHVTYRQLTDAEIGGARGSPIGAAIPDLRVYLLNRRAQPVPIGVPGEIHVGGPGVARGYLNRPELTAQRFVVDPFSGDPAARMYRSGDLGRWRPDGTIEYLGRNDQQVKIRGYRIELGEIEAAIGRHSSVRDAVVAVRETGAGDKRLVAYLVPRAETLNVGTIRTHLREILPEFMIPSAFVMVERFPLTSHGKLDRSALPAPSDEAYTNTPSEPPQGMIEEALAEIWKNLLGVTYVGRDDDFFQLGGDSLVGMKLMARIGVELGAQPIVATVFQYRTIREMSQIVEGALRSADVGRSLSDLPTEEGVI